MVCYHQNPIRRTFRLTENINLQLLEGVERRTQSGFLDGRFDPEGRREGGLRRREGALQRVLR